MAIPVLASVILPMEELTFGNLDDSGLVVIVQAAISRTWPLGLGPFRGRTNILHRGLPLNKFQRNILAPYIDEKY